MFDQERSNFDYIFWFSSLINDINIEGGYGKYFGAVCMSECGGRHLRPAGGHGVLINKKSFVKFGLLGAGGVGKYSKAIDRLGFFPEFSPSFFSSKNKT